VPPDESIAELRSRIRASIDFTASITDEELLRKTESIVFEWPESRFLSAADKVKLVKRLYHSFRGLDLLQPLMEDPLVNEIMINGHKDIFVERQGEMTKLRESFESEESKRILAHSRRKAARRLACSCRAAASLAQRSMCDDPEVPGTPHEHEGAGREAVSYGGSGFFPARAGRGQIQHLY
jgi:hypothetical protein